MTAQQETSARATSNPERRATEQQESHRAVPTEAVNASNGDPASDRDFSTARKKPVKKPPIKKPSSVGGAAYAKGLAISKRSILGKHPSSFPGSVYKRKTLLNQSVPSEEQLKPWKHTSEFTKLAVAATPLYRMALARSWELKTFTLILSKELSDRIDNGDRQALEYIRDQMTRVVRSTVDKRAEFLYAVEKAPAALADESSRRRWHLHGLMIGPEGFSKSGKTKLRLKLRTIKGEADSDFMFKSPGEKIGADPQSSARTWCVYSVKNGLSVELDPLLAKEYELPAGKPTFISALLRREAQRWHMGRLNGRTTPELIADASSGIY